MRPRAGNWLTREQASRLLALPHPDTAKGKRDRAILGLLLGCGLRRDELVSLTVEEIQQREGRWVIVPILGKGRRRRTIPVPSWVKTWIDEWMIAAGVTDGRVFRAINKGGCVYGSGLTSNIIWSTCGVMRPTSGCHNSRVMICGELARSYAELPAGIWSRFSFYWVTLRLLRRKGTWARRWI